MLFDAVFAVSCSVSVKKATLIRCRRTWQCSHPAKKLYVRRTNLFFGKAPHGTMLNSYGVFLAGVSRRDQHNKTKSQSTGRDDHCARNHYRAVAKKHMLSAETVISFTISSRKGLKKLVSLRAVRSFVA